MRDADVRSSVERCGPVEVLEHEMRPRSVDDGVERAHDHGVPQALQHARLRGDRREGDRVVHLVGPEDLDDDEREELVVPGEVRLEAAPAAEQSHGVAPGDDLVALAEAPRRVRGSSSPGLTRVANGFFKCMAFSPWLRGRVVCSAPAIGLRP